MQHLDRKLTTVNEKREVFTLMVGKGLIGGTVEDAQ